MVVPSVFPDGYRSASSSCCVAIAVSSNDSIIVMSFCGMNRDLIRLRLRFALNSYSSLVRRKQKEEKTGEYVSIK